MPIIAKDSGNNFIPAPQGSHAAVCVDVIDLGILEVTFAGEAKKQHKIKIVWQIDEPMDDGKPFIVSKRYTLSLHEKASLRKDLESWRGRAFTPEELHGFDVETILHVGCMLNVVHAPNPNGGSPYANVAAIMKGPKGITIPTPRDYVRVKDREPEPPGAPPFSPTRDEISFDDVPF